MLKHHFKGTQNTPVFIYNQKCPFIISIISIKTKKNKCVKKIDIFFGQLHILKELFDYNNKFRQVL